MKVREALLHKMHSRVQGAHDAIHGGHGCRNTMGRCAMRSRHLNARVKEVADLPAQRRLRCVQSPLGGRQQASFLRNRDEISQMPKFHGIPSMPFRHSSNHRKPLSSRQGIPILQRLPHRRAKCPGEVITGVATVFRVLNQRLILVLDAFKRQEQGASRRGTFRDPSQRCRSALHSHACRRA